MRCPVGQAFPSGNIVSIAPHQIKLWRLTHLKSLSSRNPFNQNCGSMVAWLLGCCEGTQGSPIAGVRSNFFGREGKGNHWQAFVLDSSQCHLPIRVVCLRAHSEMSSWYWRVLKLKNAERRIRKASVVQCWFGTNHAELDDCKHKFYQYIKNNEVSLFAMPAGKLINMLPLPAVEFPRVGCNYTFLYQTCSPPGLWNVFCILLVRVGDFCWFSCCGH